jgi:hypothetical protein
MIQASSRTEFKEQFMGDQGILFHIYTFAEKKGSMISFAVQMNEVFEKSRGSFPVSTPSKDEVSGSVTICLYLSDGKAHSNVLPIPVEYP